MLSKDSKIRVLENFYALDYVFFGKPVVQYENCCPLIKEEYITIKGALMSVFVEMLKLVEHSPATINEKVTINKLLESSRRLAKRARENSKKIISSSKAKKMIKESLRESLIQDSKLDINAFVENKIRERAFAIAVDNLLIARTIVESKKFNRLNEWSGRILEDSYTVLKDGLVESAISMLYGGEEK